MSEQIFVEHINDSDIVEQTGQSMNTPVVDAVLISETPGDETFSVNTGSLDSLLNREVSEYLRTRWNGIQSRFVDEPRSAVQQADELVSEVVEKIAEIFANERALLEVQWKKSNDVSTEDLRKALQYYRSFFNRMVV
jgi:hypothetical protein